MINAQEIYTETAENELFNRNVENASERELDAIAEDALEHIITQAGLTLFSSDTDEYSQGEDFYNSSNHSKKYLLFVCEQAGINAANCTIWADLVIQVEANNISKKV